MRDLGLVEKGAAGLEIANPIYREIVPRALTAITEDSLPIQRAAYIAADGHLLFDRLLEDFRDFWRETWRGPVAPAALFRKWRPNSFSWPSCTRW